MRLTVIMPALQEQGQIAQAVASVRLGLQQTDELIVVDGGSQDSTVEMARAEGALVLVGPRGRGLQMNAGAAAAKGDTLLFLHADTRLPEGFRDQLDRTLSDPAVVWGRFDVEFDSGGLLLRAIAWLISHRSRLLRSATGDQAIFVRRSLFESLDGYREPVLFEDVELVRRLRPHGRMGIPCGRATTSARRWRNAGVWRTTLRMWTLKSLYLAGVPARRLIPFYGDER